MFQQIGDGVFRRRFESLDLNVGVVIGDDGVLIVDTRATHQEALELKEELATLTWLPVRWVINTHWHWDHTFGNAMFPEAEIWGHELCEPNMIRFGDQMRVAAKGWLPEEQHADVDEVVITPPTKSFAEMASLEIGRLVQMTYHGLGHTDADIVIRTGDVAFFGDLIEEGAPPSFGDSHPLSWPLTLQLATETLPGTVVPGHGDLVGREFVATQTEELSVVADLASQLLAGELTLDEAVAAGPYDEATMRSALLRAQVVA
ncbi:MAG TPA: MBL fold metallo-hydrolase [Acidimicrobiia bacterium]|jgi:glyoxylase-like metal-dependent hydrolase (beta-lactamase superfamily II)|nr:MBL fold metallo-hydrolase [Acidimicrobiia bacterium]